MVVLLQINRGNSKTRPCDVTQQTVTPLERIVIKVNTERLHQQRNVSNQFDDNKANILRLDSTKVGILGRACEGRCFLKPADLC